MSAWKAASARRRRGAAPTAASVARSARPSAADSATEIATPTSVTNAAMPAIAEHQAAVVGRGGSPSHGTRAEPVGRVERRVHVVAGRARRRTSRGSRPCRSPSRGARDAPAARGADGSLRRRARARRGAPARATGAVHRRARARDPAVAAQQRRVEHDDLPGRQRAAGGASSAPRRDRVRRHRRRPYERPGQAAVLAARPPGPGTSRAAAPAGCRSAGLALPERPHRLAQREDTAAGELRRGRRARRPVPRPCRRRPGRPRARAPAARARSAPRGPGSRRRP